MAKCSSHALVPPKPVLFYSVICHCPTHAFLTFLFSLKCSVALGSSKELQNNHYVFGCQRQRALHSNTSLCFWEYSDRKPDTIHTGHEWSQGHGVEQDFHAEEMLHHGVAFYLKASYGFGAESLPSKSHCSPFEALSCVCLDQQVSFSSLRVNIFSLGQLMARGGRRKGHQKPEFQQASYFPVLKLPRWKAAWSLWF